MAKILITGAAGFIGSQLSYALYKQGHDVVLLDNFSYGYESNLIFEDKDFNQEILKEDILHKDYINDLIQNESFDFIFHLAAITTLPDCQVNPSFAIETNVIGTINILEAARQYCVKNIIFASTGAVYENTDIFPSKEDRVNNPSLIYPLSKYSAEQFCKSYSDVYGMNITVLRFANAYGPRIACFRQQAPVVGYIIRELFYDRKPILHSSGNQQRDFIYIDDLIDLTIKSMDKKEGFDIFNVSSNETHSINEMYQIISKYMNKEIEPIKAEPSCYWINYPKLYEGIYQIDEKVVERETLKYTLLDNFHSFDKFDWKPKTSFDEGLRKTVEYHIQLLTKTNKNNN